MGFSQREYWSGLPCLPPGDLPDPGIEPMAFMSPALAGGFFTTSTTWEAPRHINIRGFGDPWGIYRTIPQTKLKKYFTISNKTWVYVLTTFLEQGFLQSEKCHRPMKDYVFHILQSLFGKHSLSWLYLVLK